MVRVAEEAGFEVVFLSGAAISNWKFGLADYGLTTLSKVAETTRDVVSAVSISILVDADIGYGNPINVVRTVRERGRRGYGYRGPGISEEARALRTKAGYPIQEHGKKISAAVDTRGIGILC